MKVTIEVDCTPQEARAFLGLPDVAALNEHLVEEMQEADERQHARPAARGADEELDGLRRRRRRSSSQADDRRRRPSAATGADGDTIFALATAPGRAAVAMVRLSGPGDGALAVEALAGAKPASRAARPCGH